MPSYNLMKAEDRARLRADRQAEMEAVHAGRWPRDLNDYLRWIHLPQIPHLSAADSRAVQEAYVARLCAEEIAYLDDLEQRIADGR